MAPANTNAITITEAMKVQINLLRISLLNFVMRSIVYSPVFKKYAPRAQARDA